MLRQQKDGIMAILAAVLHISDIEFETDPQTDGVFVKNDNVLVLGLWLTAIVHYGFDLPVSAVDNIDCGFYYLY